MQILYISPSLVKICLWFYLGQMYHPIVKSEMIPGVSRVSLYKKCQCRYQLQEIFAQFSWSAADCRLHCSGYCETWPGPGVTPEGPWLPVPLLSVSVSVVARKRTVTCVWWVPLRPHDSPTCPWRASHSLFGIWFYVAIFHHGFT